MDKVDCNKCKYNGVCPITAHLKGGEFEGESPDKCNQYEPCQNEQNCDETCPNYYECT
jgi:hypothetical protein